MMELGFDAHGPALSALQERRGTGRDPGPGEVRVRMRYAPINPADLNLIAGTYGVRPALPACAGLEGVGEVVAVGADAALAVGDLVRPADGLGTWRTEATAAASRFQRLPRIADLVQAAMLAVNPATAWCLLDLVPLAPGARILVNGAGSNLGRCLIAFARERGLRVVAQARRAEALRDELSRLGAEAVVGEGRADLHGIGGAVLAVNQVGGDAAAAQLKVLAPGATQVTVGGLARQPITVGAGQLIFADIRLRGFWITRWYAEQPASAVEAMLASLTARVADGRLRQPVAAVIPLSRWRDALAADAVAGRAGKVVLDCQA